MSLGRIVASADDDGPLWNSVKLQLYKPEVSHVKRLVGEQLIQSNATMWAELMSLREIVTDFRQEQEMPLRSASQQRPHQHRELLRRQIHKLLEEPHMLTLSAHGGPQLEELVPELLDPRISEFLYSGSFASTLGLPDTPSAHPSSSCGSNASTCSTSCSTPEPGRTPLLTLGRALKVSELEAVAAGIRAELETEHNALAAAIAVEMRLFDSAEASRSGNGALGLPSADELQGLVHKLQGLIADKFATNAVSHPNCGSHTDDSKTFHIVGCASIHRLKALIARRREEPASQPSTPKADKLGYPILPLKSVEEESLRSSQITPISATFDPFFDDPFG